MCGTEGEGVGGITNPLRELGLAKGKLPERESREFAINLLARVYSSSSPALLNTSNMTSFHYIHMFDLALLAWGAAIYLSKSHVTLEQKCLTLNSLPTTTTTNRINFVLILTDY